MFTKYLYPSTFSRLQVLRKATIIFFMSDWNSIFDDIDGLNDQMYIITIFVIIQYVNPRRNLKQLNVNVIIP